MTAAVATMSPHQLSRHQGSHIVEEQPEDSLLDALLRACQPKPSVTLLPGFGRDLQPYFSEDAASAIGNAQKPRRSRDNNSPPKVAGASPRRVHTKKMANKKTTADVIVPLAATPTPAATPLGRKTPNRKPAANSTPPTEDMVGMLVSWAGPGFYNTPLPEQLPMPSNVLLA